METLRNIVNSESLANWAVAIGTFVLALVALKDIFLAWWKKPKLECEIKLEPPFCHKVKSRYFFRFKIWNKGKISAKNVEVILLNISEKKEMIIKS